MAPENIRSLPDQQTAEFAEVPAVETDIDAEIAEWKTEGQPARSLSVALCQINPVVGDLVGNRELICMWTERAASAGAQVVLFPELALCGYPPEDLLLRADFVDAAREQLEKLASTVGDQVVCVGFPELANDEHGVHNSLAVLQNGQVVATYAKRLLPNYGVFDERRYFMRGNENATIQLGNVTAGLSICEDIWYDDPVASGLKTAGAEIILNISASPFHAGKAQERETMIAQRANRFGLPIAYCNLVGGQDELVFDGASLVVDAQGRKVAQAPQFDESLLICDVPLPEAQIQVAEKSLPGDKPAQTNSPTRKLATLHLPPAQATAAAPLHEVSQRIEEEVYRAITLGIHDYIGKNGFAGVMIGVSGGIDSALVLALAVDALGPENVTAVVMPSPFNSHETQSDARALADNFGVKRHEFAIKPIMAAFDLVLADVFEGSREDTTEENIQARIRGTLLMALSNKLGALVLTTGNKSELAVGYATLYGDMAGGFAPLKDVPKSLVFKLTRWRNEIAPNDPPIPTGIIDRPPSAELKHGQRDEDSLGSYDLLDYVIELYIEQNYSAAQIIAQDINPEYVERTLRMIDLAEYKRRQAPPGVKITTLAFGRERRLPITARRRLQ